MCEDEWDDEDLTPEELAEREVEEREQLAARSYFRVSRSLAASFLFVLPLVIVYEIGVLLARGDVNIAAMWIKNPLSWLGRHPIQIMGANPTLILNVVLVAAVLVATLRLGHLGALHLGTFFGMFVESAAYALLIGPIALLPLTGRLGFTGFSPHLENFWTKIFTSCGAGLYEELVFRFFLLGAIYVFATAMGKMKPFKAGVLALLVSAALFSAAHFIVPGQSATAAAFIYRLGAGLVLGIIFFTRGFGIAAWTHALYDIYVLCFAATA